MDKTQLIWDKGRFFEDAIYVVLSLFCLCAICLLMIKCIYNIPVAFAWSLLKSTGSDFFQSSRFKAFYTRKLYSNQNRDVPRFSTRRLTVGKIKVELIQEEVPLVLKILHFFMFQSIEYFVSLSFILDSFPILFKWVIFCFIGF